LLLAGQDSSPEQYTKALNLTADQKVEFKRASLAWQLQIKVVNDKFVNTAYSRDIIPLSVPTARFAFLFVSASDFEAKPLTHHLVL
jgi:hypothetical protein